MPIPTVYLPYTKIRLTILCLSDFELYSRWVPLKGTALCILMRLLQISINMAFAAVKLKFKTYYKMQFG